MGHLIVQLLGGRVKDLHGGLYHSSFLVILKVPENIPHIVRVLGHVPPRSQDTFLRDNGLQSTHKQGSVGPPSVATMGILFAVGNTHGFIAKPYPLFQLLLSVPPLFLT